MQIEERARNGSCPPYGKKRYLSLPQVSEKWNGWASHVRRIAEHVFLLYIFLGEKKKMHIYVNIENILDNLQGVLVKPAKLASQNSTPWTSNSNQRIQWKNNKWRSTASLKRIKESFNLTLHHTNSPLYRLFLTFCWTVSEHRKTKTPSIPKLEISIYIHNLCNCDCWRFISKCA